MALSLEAASLVRQKTYAALGGVSNSAEHGNIWWAAVRQLFQLLNAKGVGTLQFVPFSADDAVTAGSGLDAGIDVAHKVYFVYGKKRNTATDTFLRIADDAEADSGSIDNGVIGLAYLVGDDEAAAIYPTGLAMANGLVINATTTYNGETESAAADAVDGFVVIGAA